MTTPQLAGGPHAAVDGRRTSLRRQRRIAARRLQILNAAEAIFVAKGYHGATTRHIAEKADLAEGTLYNYFPSKRELFFGVMQRRVDPLVEAIGRLQVDTVEDMVVALLASRFQRMIRERGLRMFLHEATLDPEISRYLNEQILARIARAIQEQMAQLLAAGIMRPVDPAIASWTLMGAVVGMALFSDLGAAPVLAAAAPEELAAHVSDIFLNGLARHAEDT